MAMAKKKLCKSAFSSSFAGFLDVDREPHSSSTCHFLFLGFGTDPQLNAGPAFMHLFFLDLGSLHLTSCNGLTLKSLSSQSTQLYLSTLLFLPSQLSLLEPPWG